jgi:serine/threonine protein kinase
MGEGPHTARTRARVVTDPDAPLGLPSAARWSVLEPLFDAALARAPNDRNAFLDEACGADASLRAEIGQLLVACERLEGEPRYLEQPAAIRFASLWDERFDEAQFQAAIDGRYHIECEVGRGGMAIVYRVCDRRDDRQVALKVLRTATSPGGPARFRREIALAAQLRHPHILALLDSGESDGRLWYTMPLVVSESLGARLHREGRLPIADVVRLLGEICDGLACAHERGIVHRDLKPDNVLLADGHAVIADFGVAKAVFSATHGDVPTARTDDIRTVTGVGVGTPAYMSPEQCAGERSIDHRADLYALGIMAYELLAGLTPFRGESRQALVTAHLAERPAPLSAHRRDTPAALDTLVLRLLEKQAANRPASAADVGSTLAAIGESLGETVNTPRGRWWTRRWWRG